MSLSALRRAIDIACSVPFRALPRHRRFDAVLTAGRFLAPLLGPALMRRHPGFTTAGGLDETMRLLLKAAQRRNLLLDPRVEIEAPPGIDFSSAVFVTAHFPLNGLFARWLLDQGHPPRLVREFAGPVNILGTNQPFHQIAASPTALLQIRSAHAQRHPVIMAIVPARPTWRPQAIETRYGTTTVATPIFTFAERLGLPLFFMGVRMTAKDPVVTIEPIEPDVDSFVRALQNHLGRMAP